MLFGAVAVGQLVAFRRVSASGTVVGRVVEKTVVSAVPIAVICSAVAPIIDVLLRGGRGPRGLGAIGGQWLWLLGGGVLA